MRNLKDNHISREIYSLDMGKSLKIWMSELDKLAPNTKKTYLRGVRQFLEYLDTDHEGLYNLKLEDMKSQDPRDMRRVERELSQFMFKQMNEGGLAPQTAKRTGIAVTHFMRTMGFSFSLMRNEWTRGESQGQRLVLKDQIKTMYEYASAWNRERNRALIMIAKDTGLRISDVSALDVEDYLDARSVKHEGEEFKEFKPIVTKKTKAIAYSIIGPESIQALDTYLESRSAKRGEPLFVDDKGKRMNVTAMSEQFRRFSDYLEDSSKISAHSYRKYHETMLETAGIPLNWIKRYQGRKVSDSTGPYSNPQQIPDKLLNTYMENYHVLRLFTEKRELETVKQELDQHKQNMDTMRVVQQVRDTEMADLREEVETLKRMLKGIFEETKPKA